MGDLDNERVQIDSVDSQILALIEKRGHLAKKIGEFKQKQGLQVYDPARERDVVRRAQQKSSLEPQFVGEVMRLLIDYCRLQEDKLLESSPEDVIEIAQAGTVAVLGPAGTFTQQAAQQVFSKPEFTYTSGFEEVFEMVSSKKTEYGVVALENSLEGSVDRAMDCLVEYDIKIVKEVVLDINLALIAPPGTSLEDITSVHSHPHALAQAREYLKKTLPQASVHETSSTVSALKSLKDNPGWAAIGPQVAAETHSLQVLETGVQDEFSQTRFGVIALQGNEQGNKTSIIFTTKDKPGALYSVLKTFADLKINLTKIESRPSKRKLGEYLFFLDFNGQLKDKKIRECLDSLSQYTTYLKVLGSY